MEVMIIAIMFVKLLINHMTNTKYDLVCFRMIYCMSNQVSELKTILCTASKSSSAFGPLVRHEGVDSISSNSECSSTDSDFTFPAPVSTSANFSSPGSNSPQLIVQDVSAGEVSG